MPQDSTAGSGNGPNAILAAWRVLDLAASETIARLRTTSCDECTRPIRWWNRRVWLVNRERCAHPQCWSGWLFIKGHIQELRHSAQRSGQPRDKNSADTELRELRVSAHALRERVERLEAQLEQTAELAATTETVPASIGLFAGNEHFTAGNRHRTKARMASGNSDAVIGSHRGSPKLPL
jgi:hypothetical protein